MKTIIAYVKKLFTGKCGSVFYMNGCNCIDCQKQEKEERKDYEYKFGHIPTGAWKHFDRF
jgi:hypothetical protein